MLLKLESTPGNKPAAVNKQQVSIIKNYIESNKTIIENENVLES